MNVMVTLFAKLRRQVCPFAAALLCWVAVLAPLAEASDFGASVWTNSYDAGEHDNINRAIAVDGSGNVFITGGAWISHSFSRDIATVAYSSEGVALWTNLYNGPMNGYDEAYGAAADGNGNAIVTGSSQGISGDYDTVTIKYSSAGMPLWTNRYDGPAHEDEDSRALGVDESGNVFVTGLTRWSGNPTADYVTINYSTDGVPRWTNTYDGPVNGHDYAVDLAVDGSGNVMVTGSATGPGDNTDFATIKYSGTGMPLWTNLYNGPANNHDRAEGVAVDGSGDVVVTGSSSGAYATIKYSTDGVPLWTNRFGGGYTRGVEVDGSGNVIVTGSSGGDYATIKYSTDGVPLWTNRFSGGSARGVAVDGSGNVFVTGESGGQYVTVAYSGTGAPLWTNRFDGGGDGSSNKGIAVDASGDIFVTGSTRIFRDYVTVKYVGVNSTPPVIAQVMIENGEMQVVVDAEANRAYSVEFRDFMDFGNWLTLTNIPAQPTATNLAVIDSITNQTRFYRLRTP